jgi:diacylglycerol kinase (ATP)
VHVALLVNPVARSGAAATAGARAAERLRAHGIRTSLVCGQSAAESTRLLRQAVDGGADAVVVAGGDGTVGLALQVIAGTPVPLGIVPAGTGNDLATALGMRELDPDAAADTVAAGATRTIDLARVHRPDGSMRLFGTVLASGFDARVNDRANAMRWPRGHRRYDLAILGEFARLRTARFAVEAELDTGGILRLDEPLLMATVGNGRTYGGGIPICPDADMADGLLDLTLVRPMGRGRLLRLLPRLYRGTHTSAPEVVTARVRRVRLSAAEERAYADGDAVGALPVEVDVVVGAVTLYAPGV